MSKDLGDQGKVREQYKNQDNLLARQSLHTFNRNKQDWNNWFFEKMDIPEHGRILELGCGNGFLWKKNAGAIRPSWDITLSDFSEGMLQAARESLGDSHFKYEIIDIQDIPYENDSFDIIIARHMLYHVPDIDKALSEVSRVLKPTGRFYASANGMEHMQELTKLVNDFNENIHYDLSKLQRKFGMENGLEILKKHFPNVKVEHFNGEIIIDQAEPVVAYIASTMSAERLAAVDGSFDALHRYTEAEIIRKGALHITTNTGMLTAGK